MALIPRGVEWRGEGTPSLSSRNEWPLIYRQQAWQGEGEAGGGQSVFLAQRDLRHGEIWRGNNWGIYPDRQRAVNDQVSSFLSLSRLVIWRGRYREIARPRDKSFEQCQNSCRRDTRRAAEQTATAPEPDSSHSRESSECESRLAPSTSSPRPPRRLFLSLNIYNIFERLLMSFDISLPALVSHRVVHSNRRC